VSALQQASGFDEVLSGATATCTLVEGGGIEAVFSGGTTTGTAATGGGQYDFGAAASAFPAHDLLVGCTSPATQAALTA
jgi:autotransporter passenger strand-loop-strand repeat protein